MDSYHCVLIALVPDKLVDSTVFSNGCQFAFRHDVIHYTECFHYIIIYICFFYFAGHISVNNDDTKDLLKGNNFIKSLLWMKFILFLPLRSLPPDCNNLSLRAFASLIFYLIHFFHTLLIPFVFLNYLNKNFFYSRAVGSFFKVPGVGWGVGGGLSKNIGYHGCPATKN